MLIDHKKKIVVVFLGGCLLAGQASPLFAAGTSAVFNATASVDVPVEVSISVTKINVGEPEDGSGSVVMAPGATLLSFDPLVYQSWGIWTGSSSYKFTLGSVGTSQDVTVNYQEGQNPNGSGPRTGLGGKLLINYTKTSKTYPIIFNNSPLPGHPQRPIGTPATEFIGANEWTGCRLFIWLNITWGSPGEPFTALDIHGVYDGTFTITTTASVNWS